MTTESHEMTRIREARSGASEALAWLYTHYASLVYRVAYGIAGSVADAEDVVQDVFLGLPRALQTYQGRGSFEGWLKRVAVRVTLMRLRAEKRRREISAEITSSRHQSPPPVTDRVALEEALAGLSQALRVVFVLKEVEGYEHVEIAEMLGISASASEVRLHRARRQLRLTLQGGESTTEHVAYARPRSSRRHWQTAGPQEAPAG